MSIPSGLGNINTSHAYRLDELILYKKLFNKKAIYRFDAISIKLPIAFF